MLRFTKSNNQLKVEIIVHHSILDRVNPKGVPIFSYDVVIGDDSDLYNLKIKLDK
jgi:hypothetical protein